MDVGQHGGDLSAMLDLITDDVVFMVPGREPLGKAEFVANSESVRGASLEGRAEIREIEIFDPRASYGTKSKSC
jgi:ketosteroid isomerase-like protein